MVQPGSTLFTLQRDRTDEELESLVFFPAKDGKRLEQGQRVRVSPTTTKQQRHGGIEGEISKVRSLPVRDEAIVKRLGVRSLLDSVRGAQSDPLIDEHHPAGFEHHSGYDWGGGSGPKSHSSPGTTTTVRVLVEERRPISYVIPILRDLTGFTNHHRHHVDPITATAEGRTAGQDAGSLGADANASGWKAPNVVPPLWASSFSTTADTFL